MSPPESEMAKSVRTWLGETSNAEWLDQCRSLIARHVGIGAPTLGLSALKTAGNIAIAEMLRRHCTDIDHYHRLTRVMYSLAAVQDAIIANVHQAYLRSVATTRLREQSARFRDEIGGTIGDASRRSAGLRDTVSGFA
jgi:hypothetical protein